MSKVDVLGFMHYLPEALIDFYKKIRMGSPLRKHLLEKQEGFAPFFIVGSGRSGNTLLRRILNSHSELFIPPETYVLGKSIRQFRRYNNMGWGDLVQLIYSNFEFYPEFETFDIKTLAPLVDSASRCPEEQRTLAFLLHGFYEYFAKTHQIDKSRWGDKTPLNTFAIFPLFQVFPDAKFIHIVRDPYDVVASYVASGIYKNHTDAARRWVRSVQMAEKFKSKYPGNLHEIYYETLVENPEKEIRRVCAFLDVPFEKTMLTSETSAQELGDVRLRAHHANVYKPINTKSIGRGRDAIDADTNSTIDPIIACERDKFGYAAWSGHHSEETR
ncbi:sulfotransferase [Sulfurimonas sp. HSL1-6]|uniref:sulfotransferase family protein n=1 Tax=Thiomicrolovo immobilis TaxID=3131935 RepID=UPI0031F74308